MTNDERIHIGTELARNLGDARRAKAAAQRAVEANQAALVELQEQTATAAQALIAAEGSVQEAQAARDKFNHEQSIEVQAERSRQQVAEAIQTAAYRAKASAEAARLAAEEEIRANIALATVLAGQEGN